MKGQGRLNSPLALSILAGIPVGQRVSGSTPVRQFNIRPSRMKRRCISLLRPAPPYRSTVLWRAWRLRRRTKKIRGWGPTPVELGGSGKDPAMSAARPLGAFRHAAHGPAPARQLARYRDVGHARLLAGGVHRAPPVDQPPHARVGVAARIGRDGLAGGRLLRRARRRLVVPRGLDQQFPQMLVAGLGDAAAALGLAARVLGGHQPDPCGEARRLVEPREPVGLAGDRDGRHGVDALQAPQRVARWLPPGRFRERLHLGLKRGLLLVGPADALAVVVERGHGRRVAQVDSPNPCPEIPGPTTLSLAGGVPLVVDVSVPEQELRQALLGAHGIVSGICQRSGQIACALALGVGHVHLGDHPERQLHGQEMRVAAVRLAAAVGGGPVHLRHRADDAVDAHRAQFPAQVEAGDARLVDAFRGLGEALHPRSDLAGLVTERFPVDLARGRDEGAGLYRAGVDVEPYESGSIVHRKPLP